MGHTLWLAKSIVVSIIFQNKHKCHFNFSFDLVKSPLDHLGSFPFNQMEIPTENESSCCLPRLMRNKRHSFVFKLDR